MPALCNSAILKQNKAILHHIVISPFTSDKPVVSITALRLLFTLQFRVGGVNFFPGIQGRGGEGYSDHGILVMGKCK